MLSKFEQVLLGFLHHLHSFVTKRDIGQKLALIPCLLVPRSLISKHEIIETERARSGSWAELSLAKIRMSVYGILYKLVQNHQSVYYWCRLWGTLQRECYRTQACHLSQTPIALQQPLDLAPYIAHYVCLYVRCHHPAMFHQPPTADWRWFQRPPSGAITSYWCQRAAARYNDKGQHTIVTIWAQKEDEFLISYLSSIENSGSGLTSRACECLVGPL